MDVDLLLVTGKDGVTRVYFVMGLGHVYGFNGLMWCGEWDSTTPDYFYVDKDGFVHGPMVIPLGTLEEVHGDIVKGPKFGSDINNGLGRPTPKNRSPEMSPCYLPGKEPYPGRERPGRRG